MKVPPALSLPSTRRDVLSGAAKLAVLATAATGLGLTPARAATPRKGGTLRMALAGGSSGDSLDPRTYAETVARNVGVSICNQLVEITPDNRLVPELAESWETEGATTWVIDLRKDVQFHNGKTLEAADVVYSINLHRGEDSTSGAKTIFSAIEEITQETKNQITVRLAAPNADFMYAFSDYHAMIVPDGFTDFANLVGTGGYKLNVYEPGVRALVERNENYWKPDRAHVDAVETIVINDGTARMAALRSGSADIVNRVDRKVVGLLASAGIEIVRSPGGIHWTFIGLANAQPTADNNVRLALKHAFDRQKVLDLIFGGLGIVGNDHPVAPSSPYFNAELPQTEFDPD